MDLNGQLTADDQPTSSSCDQSEGVMLASDLSPRPQKRSTSSVATGLADRNYARLPLHSASPIFLAVSEKRQWRRCMSSGTAAANFGHFVLFVSILAAFANVCVCVKPNKSPSTDGGNSIPQFDCAPLRSLHNVLSKSSSILATLDSNEIPLQPIPGDNLTVCNKSGFTCCSANMESQLRAESARNFRRIVQDKIVGLRHDFESRTSKFDRFFRELLTNSRQSLHDMFVKTYGKLYESNADVFDVFYKNMTDFYTSDSGNLGNALDDFFARLYRRMFQIMNEAYNITDPYWTCMKPTLGTIKPFGDRPQEMKLQLHRSVVAAKSFARALATGRDVVQTVMEITASRSCNDALMRMMYCNQCRGLSVGTKSCNNFCLNVISGCLAETLEIDHTWNQYTDALLDLLERVKGPYNIESVIMGVSVQVSDAIMTFQEKGQTVSEEVFKSCQRPPIAIPVFRTRRRQRRSAMDELDLSDLNYDSNRAGSKNVGPTTSGGQGLDADPQSEEDTAAGTNLYKLHKSIKNTMSKAKGFWSALPFTICNDDKVAAPASNEHNCWNGNTKAKYSLPLAGDGLINQAANPEVTVNAFGASPGTSVITDQILKLRMATTNMKAAYQGSDPRRKGNQNTGRFSPPLVPRNPVVHSNPGVVGNANEVVVDSKPLPNNTDEELTELSGSGDGEEDEYSDLEARNRVPPGGKFPEETDDVDLTTRRPSANTPADEQLLEGSGDDRIPEPRMDRPASSSTSTTTGLRPTVTTSTTTKAPQTDRRPTSSKKGTTKATTTTSTSVDPDTLEGSADGDVDDSDDDRTVLKPLPSNIDPKGTHRDRSYSRSGIPVPDDHEWATWQERNGQRKDDSLSRFPATVPQNPQSGSDGFEIGIEAGNDDRKRSQGVRGGTKAQEPTAKAAAGRHVAPMLLLPLVTIWLTHALLLLLRIGW